MNNPYRTPTAEVSPENIGGPEYVGFWPRVAASLVDTILIMAVTWPLLFSIYGEAFLLDDSFMLGTADILFNYVFPAVVVILFWIYRSATPGKMLIKAVIVDAQTGGKPSRGQLILRYLGYYVSMLPLFLGIFWVAWDRRKQGWHDKMARTVVVHRRAPPDGS